VIPSDEEAIGSQVTFCLYHVTEEVTYDASGSRFIQPEMKMEFSDIFVILLVFPRFPVRTVQSFIRGCLLIFFPHYTNHTNIQMNSSTDFSNASSVALKTREVEQKSSAKVPWIIPSPPISNDKQKEQTYLKGRSILAFRIFAKHGFDEGIAGHITLRVCLHSTPHSY